MWLELEVVVAHGAGVFEHRNRFGEPPREITTRARGPARSPALSTLPSARAMLDRREHGDRARVSSAW